MTPAPSSATKSLISVSGSVPVNAWYDNGTIYYYTEASEVYLSENSSYMFYDMRSLNSVDLSGVDTSRVTNMSYMFYRCYDLKSLNLSGWNTSNVTDMNNMFYYCQNLKSLNLSGWNTSNVINMSYMFYENN